jgi:threonine dehydrogenase-like Zn-dependent dehydrogenase
LSQMLALRGLEGEATPRFMSIDVPDVAEDEVLVQIKSAGLSAGTFSLLAAGMVRPLPMTLGHEGAGIVAAVGSAVHAFKPGDRVRIHPTLSCGGCRYCLSGRDQMCAGSSIIGFIATGTQRIEAHARYRDGCLAEFVRVPQRQIDLLADHVSFDIGAKIQYLGNAMRALRVARLPPASTLMILGPTGAMGVATIKLARFFGVQHLVLVGRSTARLNEVKALSDVRTEVFSTEALGDDWVASDALARAITRHIPDGVDAAVDYLPAGGDLWQALGALATGATLVNMGAGPIPFAMTMRAIVGKCLNIVGSRNHSRLDAQEVIGLLAEGSLRADELITHRHRLERVEEAIQQLLRRSESVWMSVVHP